MRAALVRVLDWIFGCAFCAALAGACAIAPCFILSCIMFGLPATWVHPWVWYGVAAIAAGAVLFWTIQALDGERFC